MDWKLLISAGALVFNIITVIIVISTKFNDLKHLERNVNDIKDDLERIDKKTDRLSERVSNIEGRLSS